jgi:hypothetical protein
MKIFFGLITASVILFSCNVKGKDSAGKEDNDYEKSKESLEQREQKNPTKFITVDGDKKKNLIGQTVVKGEVFNNAKIVMYKDVDVKISFYSKTGTILEEDHETVFENIAPGKSAKFKAKMFTPKGADSVSFKVEGAKF